MPSRYLTSAGIPVNLLQLVTCRKLRWQQQGRLWKMHESELLSGPPMGNLYFKAGKSALPVTPAFI